MRKWKRKQEEQQQQTTATTIDLLARDLFRYFRRLLLFSIADRRRRRRSSIFFHPSLGDWLIDDVEIVRQQQQQKGTKNISMGSYCFSFFLFSPLFFPEPTGRVHECLLCVSERKHLHAFSWLLRKRRALVSYNENPQKSWAYFFYYYYYREEIHVDYSIQ